MEQLVPFEEYLQLHSTDTSVVQIPEYILVTNNGRSFKLVPFVYAARLFYFFFYLPNFNIVFLQYLLRFPVYANIYKKVIIVVYVIWS